MAKVDIVLLVWNEPELTKECVDSIMANTRVDCRLLVVDNASERKTKDYLANIKSNDRIKVEIITNDKNLGFVGGMNTGLKASSAPYVCIMNNDTVAGENWLSEMLKVAQAYPDIGIVNPNSNMFGADPQELQDGFIEVGAAVGFCMLIKKELKDRIGCLSEEFSGFFFEDTDYSRRAQAAGYRCVIARKSYVFHHRHKSVGKLNNREKIFRENREHFHKKWGRPLRIAYISGDAKETKDVLQNSVSMARGGNFVHIFMKFSAGNGQKDIFRPNGVSEHADVRINFLNSGFFGLFCFYRIIKRLKKRYDIIICQGRSLMNILSAFKFFHGADVAASYDERAKDLINEHRRR